MPALVPLNSTSPLQILLPQLLCFTIQHEDGDSGWVHEVQSLEKVAQLQAIISKLEEGLFKSRRKNKELVDRNEQLQNQIVLATTQNHELQDHLLQLHHNLTLRNHQLGEDVVLVQRNLSMRSVDLVRRLLRVEKDHEICQLTLQSTNDALNDIKEHINSTNVALEMSEQKVQQLTEQNNKAKKVLNADRRIAHEAARSGNAQLVQILAELGVNLSTRAKNGYTPLHWSAMAGHLATTKALLDVGVTVDARDSNLNTPLHRAAEFGHLQVCQLLIDKGAEVNAKTKYNNTPLHVAAQGGHLEVVKLLVQLGADINARNNWSKTAWEDAVLKKRTDVAAWLALQ